MNGDMVLGIAGVLALSVAGAVVLRLLLCSPAWINWVADVGIPSVRRKVRRVEEPLGRPIQEIASSARRLGAEFHGGAPGRSWVKSEAVRRAYDQVLTEACRALEIDTDLLAIDPSPERDAERLRVEHLLATAGLVFRNAA